MSFSSNSLFQWFSRLKLPSLVALSKFSCCSANLLSLGSSIKAKSISSSWFIFTGKTAGIQVLRSRMFSLVSPFRGASLCCAGWSFRMSANALGGADRENAKPFSPSIVKVNPPARLLALVGLWKAFGNVCASVKVSEPLPKYTA